MKQPLEEVLPLPPDASPPLLPSSFLPPSSRAPCPSLAPQNSLSLPFQMAAKQAT